MSATTATGWWKAPTRFLPAGRSTPVLPPTAASTMPSTVVGRLTSGTPRSQVAAANPATSVVAPPPTATTGSARRVGIAASRSYRPATTSRRLASSPAGTSSWWTARPRLPRACPARPATSATGPQDTTAAASAPGNAGSSWSSRSTSPVPMRTG